MDDTIGQIKAYDSMDNFLSQPQPRVDDNDPPEVMFQRIAFLKVFRCLRFKESRDDYRQTMQEFAGKLFPGAKLDADGVLRFADGVLAYCRKHHEFPSLLDRDELLKELGGGPSYFPAQN